jgi:mannose-1-phosphate guanylyltransferase
MAGHRGSAQGGKVIHGVIMAGGSGTRFWPKSRRRNPKQLLSITGADSMIQETFHRLTGRIPAERIHVITNSDQVDGVREHLPALPASNIVAEPAGRNTAACIGLAAVRIANADPDGLMVIVPSDSFIDPAAAFLRVIDCACKAAEQNAAMVVIGIPPTFPSTGYGYIHRGGLISEESGVRLFEVLEFKEKPDLSTATGFFESGSYYWNSGSFIWKVSTIVNALCEFMPELHAALQRIADSLGTPQEDQVVAAEYQGLQSISIDYGVMEYARNVKVVEATYAWDDVGSWRSIENLRGRDDAGNVLEGRALVLDTNDCTVIGDPEHLIATVGVDNLIIVHTPDATLVCRKDKAQDVKKIVDILKGKGMTDLL